MSNLHNAYSIMQLIIFCIDMIKIFLLEMSFCVNIIFIIFRYILDLEELGDKFVLYLIALAVVSCKRPENSDMVAFLMLLLEFIIKLKWLTIP